MMYRKLIASGTTSGNFNATSRLAEPIPEHSLELRLAFFLHGEAARLEHLGVLSRGSRDPLISGCSGRNQYEVKYLPYFGHCPNGQSHVQATAFSAPFVS